MNNTGLKKSLINSIGCFGIVVCSSELQAASFDCAKATTSMEKLICSNDYISDLDEELGQAYKEALVKYADKKDILVRQQRNWLKWIRSQCTDPSCLDTLYGARIGELINGTDVVGLNGPDKPNFVLSKGHGIPVCEEYLTVLNSNPREELHACKLPDLSNSNIKPVEFKPLTGEQLKTVDQIVYEQNGGGPWTDWEQKWPERVKEYAIGYRQLSEAYWDLDKDGNPDQIVKESYPSSSCIPRGIGNASELRRKIKKDWHGYSQEVQFESAKKNGFINFYSLIRDGKLSFVDADNFIIYDGKYLSIDQDDMVLRKTSNEWSDREWVKIWGVNPKRDDSHRDFDQTPSMCEFWFNK